MSASCLKQVPGARCGHFFTAGSGTTIYEPLAENYKNAVAPHVAASGSCMTVPAIAAKKTCRKLVPELILLPRRCPTSWPKPCFSEIRETKSGQKAKKNLRIEGFVGLPQRPGPSDGDGSKREVRKGVAVRVPGGSQ